MTVEYLLALAHFAADYHTGQGSRGYQLLCGASRSLRRRGVERPLDCRLDDGARRLYRRLAARFGDRV